MGDGGGFDVLQGIKGAVSGATGAAEQGDSGHKIRLNKPIPKSYGGTAEDTDSYKRGGKVKRTGLAKVHRGEKVLTKKQARKYSKKRGQRK